MGHDVTLGGERLGSGKKEKVYLREYNRSTHNIGYLWRSTMASGTLVPFLNEVGTPGTTFDIELNTDVKTHPTIGPLFGSYKLQLDVFSIPIRLYNAKLHMNALGIGMDMQSIKLPQIELRGKPLYFLSGNLDNQQINPSCILKYLGISGLGQQFEATQKTVKRLFNAVPYLGYWDIYKNYYANKQEEIGMVIHHQAEPITASINGMTWFVNGGGTGTWQIPPLAGDPLSFYFLWASRIDVSFASYQEFDPSRLTLVNTTLGIFIPFTDIFQEFIWDAVAGVLRCQNPFQKWINKHLDITHYEFDNTVRDIDAITPQLVEFPLNNIDQMRLNILTWQANSAYTIDRSSLDPYSYALDFDTDVNDNINYSAMLGNQEGLAIKTYQSDVFNNWISTEWIDGDNGVNAITAIDTSGGSFTIPELNLSNKIYNMLNRIALSGGTYDDWLSAVYTHDRVRQAESPIYMGGLSKEIVFQEVVSTTALPDNQQPLGQLAGRGVLGKKHKGGRVRIRIDEPSYIMGLVSITPRIDYSQGNAWHMNLKSIDDLHKPALDEIGFQDLITDQVAAWDSETGDNVVQPLEPFKTIGKQPAWINYMTNVNRVYGNFADEREQMFMVLNRRYEPYLDENQKIRIKDMTTYIDPVKFNYIFADTRLDAQNFWVQIGVDMTRRAKMSAKVIPNL